MHFAFKFSIALKVINREKRFAAIGAKILQALPVVPEATCGAFKMREKHAPIERMRSKLKRWIGRSVGRC
jgi:hypothetical protein